MPRAIPALGVFLRDCWKILTSATRALEVADDFVTSLEYTFPMSKPEKTQQKPLPKGRPFAGDKRANIKALKLGLFNPTEELEKMNEGAQRPA